VITGIARVTFAGGPRYRWTPELQVNRRTKISVANWNCERHWRSVALFNKTVVIRRYRKYGQNREIGGDLEVATDAKAMNHRNNERLEDGRNKLVRIR